MCNLHVSQDCNSLLNDTALLTPECLASMCKAACSGNLTSAPVLKDLNYHVEHTTLVNDGARSGTWQNATRRIMQLSGCGTIHDSCSPNDVFIIL